MTIELSGTVKIQIYIVLRPKDGKQPNLTANTTMNTNDSQKFGIV